MNDSQINTGIDGWSKGAFYSESGEEMWNRHIKVPKIAPGLFFPVCNMNFSDKMLFFTIFVLMKPIYLKQEQISTKVIINNF